MGAEFTRTYAMQYGSRRHQPQQPSLNKPFHEVNASADLLRVAARANPYGMAFLALGVGWLFGLLLEKGRSPGGERADRLPRRG